MMAIWLEVNTPLLELAFECSAAELNQIFVVVLQGGGLGASLGMG